MQQPRVNPRTFRFALETVVTGIAQVSTTSTIKLAAGDVAADDFYNGMLAVITVSGTGGPPVGERALITNYATGTKIATIKCVNNPSGLWTAAPAADTEYAIYAFLSKDSFIGLAQAGAGNTIRSIVLADKENIRDGFLEGLDIQIVAGTGAVQGRKSRIRQYVGASRLASVEGDFIAIPDATSAYMVEGHLYYPVKGIVVTEAAAGVVLGSYHAGGLALGAKATGTEMNEKDLGGLNYLELAMRDAAGTIEVSRWE